MRNPRALFTNGGIILLFIAILGFMLRQFGNSSSAIDSEARQYLGTNLHTFLDAQGGWYSDGLWARASGRFREEWPPEKLATYFREKRDELGTLREITAINRGTGGFREASTDYRMDYDIECGFEHGHAIVSIGIAHQSSNWTFDRLLITPAPSSP